MKTLNLVQGSKSWLEARTKYNTASEAPAMMGASLYQSRDALLKQKKFGIAEEVTPAVQKLFDKGHATEALARPFAESIIGEDLFPCTGADVIDGVELLASFDGLTMMEDINWEHKLWNENLAKAVVNEDLAESHYWQLEQQMIVSGASKTLFMVSDGTDENMVFMWYYPVEGRREALISGWKQFNEDLANYEHVEPTTKVIAESVADLPAVRIEVDGGIAIIDNLAVFGEALTGFVEKINSEPETDQDFANLESAVKTLKSAEDALDTAENMALSQADSIDVMRRTVAQYRSLARDNRLIIDKLVKAKKDTIKAGIINTGRTAIGEYQDSLANSLGGDYITTTADFVSVVKGKKTIDSMRSAINDEVARVKIEMNEQAEVIRTNLKFYESKKDYHFLFHSIENIITQDADNFELRVMHRINEYEAKLADDKKKADQAEKEKLAESKKPAESGVSPENQSFVAEMEGDKPATEPTEEAHELSKADEKKQKADQKKVKAYFNKLTGYAVPSVDDKRCSQILAKAVEKLTEMQDFVESQFPE